MLQFRCIYSIGYEFCLFKDTVVELKDCMGNWPLLHIQLEKEVEKEVED
jgi:hypothetical protein